LFAAKIAKVKEAMPDAFIGVDVIVGTRGESEELFQQAYDFIKGLDISQLHVFSYSERPGTQALKLGGAVSPAEKHRRSQLLIALSEEKRLAFYEKYCGKEAVVLFEKPRSGMPMGGFTANYIRVETAADSAMVNRLVRVRLGSFNEDKSALTVDEIIEVIDK
jgi:threonylcarbamoyladenosine tRNA methylthiotransferase MtaB